MRQDLLWSLSCTVVIFYLVNPKQSWQRIRTVHLPAVVTTKVNQVVQQNRIQTSNVEINCLHELFVRVESKTQITASLLRLTQTSLVRRIWH
jgi:hypothetical protein